MNANAARWRRTPACQTHTWEDPENGRNRCSTCGALMLVDMDECRDTWDAIVKGLNPTAFSALFSATASEKHRRDDLISREIVFSEDDMERIRVADYRDLLKFTMDRTSVSGLSFMAVMMAVDRVRFYTHGPQLTSL